MNTDAIKAEIAQEHLNKILKLDTPVLSKNRENSAYFNSDQVVQYVKDNNLNGKYWETKDGIKMELRISVDTSGRHDRHFVWLQERFDGLMETDEVLALAGFAPDSK